MDLSAADTTARPTFPYRRLSLSLLLVPFLVAALMLLHDQYAQSKHISRQLASGSSVGGGVLSVMATIGMFCACLRHCLTGCPESLCGKLFYGWIYMMINSATIGLCGMIWLGWYFCRKTAAVAG